MYYPWYVKTLWKFNRNAWPLYTKSQGRMKITPFYLNPITNQVIVYGATSAVTDWP